MSFPNPDKAPWTGPNDIAAWLAEARLRLYEAEDVWDRDCVEPAVAELAYARSFLMRAVARIDALVEVYAEAPTHEVAEPVRPRSHEEMLSAGYGDSDR